MCSSVTDLCCLFPQRSVQYELVRMQPMFKQNLLEGVSTFQNAVGTFLEQYDSVRNLQILKCNQFSVNIFEVLISSCIILFFRKAPWPTE